MGDGVEMSLAQMPRDRCEMCEMRRVGRKTTWMVTDSAEPGVESWGSGEGVALVFLC